MIEFKDDELRETYEEYMKELEYETQVWGLMRCGGYNFYFYSTLN